MINNNTMYSRYHSQVRNSNCKVLDKSKVILFSTPNNSIENSYHIMIPPGIFYDKYMENS